MIEQQAKLSVSLSRPNSVGKQSSGRVEAWMLWAIWLSTWFSPFKLNVGLNLGIEFLLAYLLLLYYLVVGRFSVTQVAGLVGLCLISALDFTRENDPKAFVFLGFAFVAVAMTEFARRPVASVQRFIYLFLSVPVLAALIRFLVPEWGSIEGYDQTIVSGESVQRFNLLGYESNSLATMMAMLLGAVLAGIGHLRSVWRVIYCFFCIAIVAATFSRSGLFAVIAILLYFTYAARSGSFAIVFSVICGILGAVLLWSDLGPVLETISTRATAFNYFEDERGYILIDRMSELLQSPSMFLFGRGFMVLGASDNSLLALLHGYGLVGSLSALIFLLISSGIVRGKLKLHPQLGGILIAILFFILTGDIYGQAKILGCFYCLVAARSSVKVK